MANIQGLSIGGGVLRLIPMVAQAKIMVTAGNLEIDVSGATVEVDARLIQMSHDATWSIVLERVKDARDAAIEAANDAAREDSLPERGTA